MAKIDTFNARDLVLPGQTTWWQLDGKGGCYKLTDEEFRKANNIPEGKEIVTPQEEQKRRSLILG